MRKKLPVVLLLSVAFILMLVFPLVTAKAQPVDYYINGQVADATANLPIKDATIQVYDATSSSVYSTWRLITIAKTDSNGRFSIRVKGDVQYGIYAYYDEIDSPGFDYLPMFRLLSPLKGNSTLSFKLVPAMSVMLLGDLRFVESSRPTTAFVFNIKNYTLPPSENAYVLTFGSSPPCRNFLNTSSSRIIIPLSGDIYIEVNANITDSGRRTSKNFTINDLESVGLEKGKLIQVNMEDYSLKYVTNALEEEIASSENVLENIERAGFYVTAEKQDLSEVKNLIVIAKKNLDDDKYNDAYANLKSAYIDNVEINTRLRGIYTDASASLFALLLFFGFTSGIIAYVASEKTIEKIVITLLFFTSFIAILYYSYPGCSLVPTTTLMEYCAIALTVTFLTAIILPHMLKEQFTSTFSLAKRQLRQRRLRFILTLVSVTVLVMSFVSFTSFSTGYGLTTRSIYGVSQNPNGLLIKEPVAQGMIIPFIPIDPSVVTLIQKENIAIVSPKAENIPFIDGISIDYLSSLSNPSERLPLLGILGFRPSAEAEITHIDRIVSEGRYLNDDDQNSILISIDAAKELGVTFNDRLLLTIGDVRTEVTVVGLFNDGVLAGLKDIDGGNILPQKYIRVDDELYLETCDPSEVIITSLQFALQVRGVVISRIGALSEDAEENASVARRIALALNMEVLYSSGGRQYSTSVGSYLETRGLSILIPWIIVIFSIAITMLNAIYEERREIAILSSIGLNPSHITGLFIAEATIIGIIGGGVGYLFGLSNYKVMSIFSIIVEVRAKVSAVWSIAAILVSLAAVLVGAIVAIRSSAVLTPSLLRRWHLEEKTSSDEDAQIFEIPFRIREEDLDSMFHFIRERIEDYFQMNHVGQYFLRMKWFDEKTPEIHRRGFITRFTPIKDQNTFVYPFEFAASKKTNEATYSLTINFKQSYERESVYRTVSFIRMTLVEWSSSKDANR